MSIESLYHNQIRGLSIVERLHLAKLIMSDAVTPMDYILQDWTIAGLRQTSAFRAFLMTMPAASVKLMGHCSARDWQEIQTRLA